MDTENIAAVSYLIVYSVAGPFDTSATTMRLDSAGDPEGGEEHFA